MPSDLRERVKEAFAGPRDEFRSTLVSFHEELRGMLSDVGRTDDDWAEELAIELGPFAVGRIDTGGLAAVLSEKETLTPDSVEVIRRARDVLAEMTAGADDEVFEVEVPPGGDLRDSVRDALAGVGRFFGAARAAALARTGAWRPDEHEGLFQGLPFRSWSTRERAVAPPILVRVRWADLRPAGLADFLDGTVKLVLVVEGEAPPAALARLVSPGAMVVQTTDPDELAPLADFAGPGVAALFEGASTLEAGADGIVPFRHDPRLGDLPWQRLEVKGDAEALRKLAREKRWRRGWKEDLEHLLSMATAPTGAAPSGAETVDAEEAPEPVSDADRLAAWLLARTDLDDA